MSELRTRLERLAGRGTPRGADDVLRAAQRSGPREIGVTARSGDERDLEVIDDIPFVSAQPARRRGRFSVLIAATGVAALAGVGMLAVTAMFGSGGADSPEAAVRQLASAVSNQDPLAAVDVLAPSEVRSMHESVQHISDRAADLKLVDKASEPLAGVDLAVDNLQLSATDLADGYAKVTVTGGTVSASTHLAALSDLLQAATRDAKDTTGKVDLARLASGSDLPTFVVTVRHDGRWYVSPAYTAVEYLREYNDGPPAQFGSADASKLGADTPGHAVEDALRAWQQNDYERLLALAPPEELPLYDYRAWIRQEIGDLHADFTIDRLTTTADVSGDQGIVKLEASGSMGQGSDRSTWQVGGTCPSIGTYFGYTFTDDPASEASSGPGFCIAGTSGQVIPFGLLMIDPAPEGSASGPVAIRVVQEDGRWFVSPIGTALRIVDDFVQNVSERTLYSLIGLGYRLPPDATLTLNEPLKLAAATRFGEVLAFDGQAGQRVVGLNEGSDSRYGYYVSGQLYTADGRDLGYIDFAPKRKDQCCAYTATLPTTGSYKIVIQQPLPAGMTLTLFDEDHAPKGLLDPNSSCTNINGVTSCFGNAEGPLEVGGRGAAVATPTTTVAGWKEVTATSVP